MVDVGAAPRNAAIVQHRRPAPTSLLVECGGQTTFAIGALLPRLRGRSVVVGSGGSPFVFGLGGAPGDPLHLRGDTSKGVGRLLDVTGNTGCGPGC